MSLGQELAPYLPFLRRYARALFGSQGVADAVVTYVMKSIIEKPEQVFEAGDARLGLYRAFHDVIADAPANLLDELADWQKDSEEHEPAEKVTRRRLRQISSSNREALLLTSLEGFTTEDAALITRSDAVTVEKSVSEALLEIERQTLAKVLIVEDHRIVAMDLRSIVESLGHEVVGIARNTNEALSLDRPDVGLILMDIQLADGESGLDTAKVLLANRVRPIIFITAFPERLLDRTHAEATFLITKPFQRSTVKAAIAQALFFDAATLPDESDVARSPALVDAKRIVAKPGPVNAEVSNGQLRLVDATPTQTAVADETLDGARKLHFSTAKNLSRALDGSNAAPRLHRRLEAIRRALSGKLTEERSLQLGIQANGFETMLFRVSDELDDELLADLSVFAADLLDLVRQFPNYWTFQREAASLKPLSNEERSTLSELVTTFTQQPDEIVEPTLKVAIEDVRNVAVCSADPVSELALVRTAGNIVRAIARSINKHASAVFKKAGSDFDNTAGRLVGVSLATILVGSPIVGLLLILKDALPQEFGFAAALVRLARSLMS